MPSPRSSPSRPQRNRASPELRLRQARTLSNLSRIGRALWSIAWFTGILGRRLFRGPDGKPWHSLGACSCCHSSGTGTCSTSTTSRSLGTAKNLRLLDKIPAVYHDPIYGDQPGQFTHDAAVAGSSWLIPTAFPVSGMEMKDVTILPLKRLSEQDVSRDGNGELRVQNSPILKFEPSNSRQMYLEQVVFDNFAIVVAGVAPTENPLDEA